MQILSFCPIKFDFCKEFKASSRVLPLQNKRAFLQRCFPYSLVMPKASIARMAYPKVRLSWKSCCQLVRNMFNLGTLFKNKNKKENQTNKKRDANTMLQPTTALGTKALQPAELEKELNSWCCGSETLVHNLIKRLRDCLPPACSQQHAQSLKK